jgi:hypothetical protein
MLKQKMIAFGIGCSVIALNYSALAAVDATTSWAVSRVASASQGSYCTMAQKYSDGTILTFARNPKNEYSLALDFQSPVFAPDKKQGVGLLPLGGKTKTFQITPQTDKTAVIIIGQDKEFIEKLSSSQSLAVSIGDKPMSFSMADFSIGYSELDSCLSGIDSKKDKAVSEKKQKKDEPIPIAKTNDGNDNLTENVLSLPPTPMEEKISLAKDVDIGSPVSMDSEINKLKEENAKLKRVINEQRQTFEDRIGQNEGAILTELRQKINSLEQENSKLKNQPTPNQSIEVDLTKALSDNKKLQDKLIELEKNNQSLLASSKNNVSSDEDLALIQKNKGLESQLDNLMADNKNLRDQVEKLQKSVEKKQIDYSGGNWDLEQVTRRYQESQREVQRLGNLLQGKDSQCTAEKKEIESLLFDPAIADKAQIALVNSLELKVKETEDKLKSADEELKILRVKASPEKDIKISELEKDIDILRNKLVSKEKDLLSNQEKIVGQLREELASKNKQIVDLQNVQNEITTIRGESVQKETIISDLQQKLKLNEKSVSEHAQLKQEFAQKDSLISSLQADVKKKDAEIEQLKVKSQQALTDAQQQLSQENLVAMQALQSQVLQGNQKIAELQKQISVLSQQTFDKGAVESSKTSVIASQKISPTVPLEDESDKGVKAPLPKPSEISSLLKKSGLVLTDEVMSMTDQSSDSYHAYKWKTDSLFGSAEVHGVTNPEQMNAIVSQYLNRAKTRCEGEFAAIPSSPDSSASQIRGYDIACVGEKKSSSASVLFKYRDNMVIVISHEGRAESIDLAIDARDRVLDTLN